MGLSSFVVWGIFPISRQIALIIETCAMFFLALKALVWIGVLIKSRAAGSEPLTHFVGVWDIGGRMHISVKSTCSLRGLLVRSAYVLAQCVEDFITLPVTDNLDTILIGSESNG